MFGSHFHDPELNFLRVFSFFKSVYLDEQFFNSHIGVSSVVVYFFLSLEMFSIFLEFFDHHFVFLFILLHVFAEGINLSLHCLNAEFELVELLVFVYGDVVENFCLHLLKGFFDVFWGNFFDQGGLALGNLPEGFLLDLLYGVLELAYLFVAFHLQLL